jgi:hypothetical protein
VSFTRIAFNGESICLAFRYNNAKLNELDIVTSTNLGKMMSQHKKPTVRMTWF